MLSDAAIISANMRGGYVNVGNSVHTLFRMNRRAGCARKETETVEVAAVKVIAALQSKLD